MASTTNETVKIRVKSASYRCDDLDISCYLESSVKDVKEIIRELYPLHPEVKEQRIIYAGHLLEDDQVLRDIFASGVQGSVSGGFIFHLACNSAFLRKINSAAKIESKVNENQTGNISASGEGSAGSLPNPMTSAAPGGMPYNMLALHQMYVEQMMAFMNQRNQGYNWQGWNYSSPQNTGIVNSQWPIPGGQIPGQPQSPQYQPEQVPPPQPDINLQPPVRNDPPPNPMGNIDDDEQPRDFLDLIYTCTRLLLILSVVYFYSNFARFALVLLFTGLLMLAQRRGILNERRAVPEPALRDDIGNPLPEIQDLFRFEELGQEQREGEANAEAQPGSPGEGLLPVAEAQAQQQRFHPFEVTRTFLMTFFTSLIPEINGN